MRTCRKCGSERPLDDFVPKRGCVGGRAYTCWDCEREYQRVYSKTPRQAARRLAYSRAWRERNRERHNQRSQEWKVANAAKSRTIKRRSRVKRKYGLTLEEWEWLQKQPCSICGSLERIKTDHDHTTGVVRGPLCHLCNVGLGHFRDDPCLLRRAVEYLMGTNEKPLGRFNTGRIGFVGDEYHIAPKYDSASEPEANGRPAEQTIGGVASAKLDQAKAMKADLPPMWDESYGGSEDLLSGAPKGGDRPDNPVHPDPQE